MLWPACWDTDIPTDPLVSIVSLISTLWRYHKRAEAEYSPACEGRLRVGLSLGSQCIVAFPEAQYASSRRGMLLQDYSCVVVADAKGLRIFSLDTRQVCYQIEVGAVSAAEMLFSTSLLAFVGSGARLCHHR